jgi:hypothetical protein
MDGDEDFFSSNVAAGGGSSAKDGGDDRVPWWFPVPVGSADSRCSTAAAPSTASDERDDGCPTELPLRPNAALNGKNPEPFGGVEVVVEEDETGDAVRSDVVEASPGDSRPAPPVTAPIPPASAADRSSRIHEFGTLILLPPPAPMLFVRSGRNVEPPCPVGGLVPIAQSRRRLEPVLE